MSEYMPIDGRHRAHAGHQQDLVERVVVRTHLDGDPRPRLDEIEEWQALRRKNRLDEMVACILAPDDNATLTHFPGYKEHWWSLTDKGVDATEVDLEII